METYSGDGAKWHELLAHQELVQAATALALRKLLEAYRQSPEGPVVPTTELLTRYQNAAALREAAEQALLEAAKARGRQGPEQPGPQHADDRNG